MLVLRTVTLLSHKLEPVVNDLKNVFDLEVGYVDESEVMSKQFGLINNMLPVGSQFIEVMEPLREKTAGNKFLRQRGEGGYMFVTQTDDPKLQDGMISRADKMGVRVAFDHRLTTEELTSRHVQFHPADTGGSFYQIDYESVNELEGHFTAAGGRDWMKSVRTDLATAITAVEVQAIDVDKVAGIWSKLIGIPFKQNGQGHREISLDRAAIRFVEASDGRSDGLSAMDLSVKDPDKIIDNAKNRNVSVNGSQIIIGGIKINLV